MNKVEAFLLGALILFAFGMTVHVASLLEAKGITDHCKQFHRFDYHGVEYVCFPVNPQDEVST